MGSDDHRVINSDGVHTGMSGQEERTRIISADESEVHDEPHIEGTCVTVRRVHERVERDGLRPETVADRLGIGRAQVYNALAYYHENPEDMRAAEDRRRERIEANKESRFKTISKRISLCIPSP